MGNTVYAAYFLPTTVKKGYTPKVHDTISVLQYLSSHPRRYTRGGETFLSAVIRKLTGTDDCDGKCRPTTPAHRQVVAAVVA